MQMSFTDHHCVIQHWSKLPDTAVLAALVILVRNVYVNLWNILVKGVYI